MARSPWSLLAAAALLLTGCGQHAAPMALQAMPNFAVLDDFPTIDVQIKRALLGTTDHGTLVSELPSPDVVKPMTFLTYKALDNDLAPTLMPHLNTLENAGSNRNVNVLALTDEPGARNTYCYYIRQDHDPKTVTSPYAIADGRGNLDTGAPQTLERTVKWAYGKYPCRFRWLDVNDHGGGYYGIAQDDRSNKRISLPDLASAIAAGSGQPVDLLSFDACLMASTEVAYEMRHVAKVMVASEDESYAVGMNYDQTIEAMSTQPTLQAPALARDLVARVNTQAIFTISAVDLSKADALAHAVDGLAGALLAAMPTQRAQIVQALNDVKPFYVAGPNPASFDHRDLDEVVDALRAHVSNPLVQAACVRVKTALFDHGAILATHNVDAEQGAARGLSIYLPLDGNIDPIYMNTAFAKDTRWPAFLQSLKS